MHSVYEDYAARYIIKFSTNADPRKSKSKCIFMVEKSRNVDKPVPLQLCGRDFPRVYELHISGTMEFDCNIARAKCIDHTVEVRHFLLPHQLQLV